MIVPERCFSIIIITQVTPTIMYGKKTPNADAFQKFV